MLSCSSWLCHCIARHSHHERHCHCIGVSPTLMKQLEVAGLHFVGKDESGDRMEVSDLVQSLSL